MPIAVGEGIQLGNNAGHEDGTLGSGMSGGGEAVTLCFPEPPTRWFLHSKFSLMWVEFKDQVDELTNEI